MIATYAIGLAITKEQTSEVIYVDVPSPPEIVYVEVEVEKEAEQSESLLAAPYYIEIAEDITESEIEMLAKITWLEAGNQSFTGQRCIVEVVLNRVLDTRFPDEIKDVLYQKNQFSHEGSTPIETRLAIAKPTEEQYEAVYATLSATEPILRSDVVFFAKGVGKNQTLYEKIGAHCFCC